jgi:phenylacetic acid degradation protein PaaD
MAVDSMIDVTAIFGADRAAQAVGMELLAFGPGSAHTALTIRPDQVNGLDAVHGGVVFLLADTAFAMACNSYGRPTVARSCQIEFLAGATIGVVSRHGRPRACVRAEMASTTWPSHAPRMAC